MARQAFDTPTGTTGTTTGQIVKPFAATFAALPAVPADASAAIQYWTLLTKRNGANLPGIYVSGANQAAGWAFGGWTGQEILFTSRPDPSTYMLPAEVIYPNATGENVIWYLVDTVGNGDPNDFDWVQQTTGSIAGANDGYTDPTQKHNWSAIQRNAVESIPFAANIVYDASTGGGEKKVTLTGDVTSFSVTNLLENEWLTINLYQDATGGRGVVFTGIAGIEPTVNSGPDEHTSFTIKGIEGGVVTFDV